MPKSSPLRRWMRVLGAVTLAFALAAVGLPEAQAQQQKPNILVIMGDDIGWFNPSAYHQGIMGYQTPNIDRIAQEGARFTDWYGQQSCTAGRAAFITGQSPIRTGLTKVGLPGADIGLRAEDPSVAELLKPLGYATGQFGKNHLGDKDEFLPTNHGFDEFFGNLYHLNAEEEPENSGLSQESGVPKRFGPRGVIKSHGRRQRSRIPARSPRSAWKRWTRNSSLLRWISLTASTRPGSPSSATSTARACTYLRTSSQNRRARQVLGLYPDGMVEHDGHVGQLLKKLDDLGIANNTIVVYTTDNGAEVMSWPDGGSTPFRGEKATNWEGASACRW